jgi:hypothetical protein
MVRRTLGVEWKLADCPKGESHYKARQKLAFYELCRSEGIRIEEWEWALNWVETTLGKLGNGLLYMYVSGHDQEMTGKGDCGEIGS